MSQHSVCVLHVAGSIVQEDGSTDIVPVKHSMLIDQILADGTYPR